MSVWGQQTTTCCESAYCKMSGVCFGDGVEDCLVGDEQQAEAHGVLGVGVAAAGQCLDVVLDVSGERCAGLLALLVGVGLPYAPVVLQRELGVEVQLEPVGHREGEVGPAAAVAQCLLSGVAEVVLEPGVAQHVLGEDLAPVAALFGVRKD